jgi:hypothetical protein
MGRLTEEHEVIDAFSGFANAAKNNTMSLSAVSLLCLFRVIYIYIYIYMEAMPSIPKPTTRYTVGEGMLLNVYLKLILRLLCALSFLFFKSGHAR